MIIALASIAAMALAPTQGASACSIPAWIADPDPAGANLRAEPSPAGRLVGKLPGKARWPDENFAPELEITGFSNGWASVRGVHFADYGDGSTELFRGSAWISGRLLSASLSGDKLYAAPRTDAQVIARFTGEESGSDAIAVLGIEDCFRDFAKVRVKLPDGSVRTGWTQSPCANQATTCS